MKILVVDDGQLAINSLIRILCRVAPDCDYISAMTTDDALTWLRQGPMDAAFLNLEMPGMNGLALARMIQKIQPRCNLIVVTEHPEYALEALQIFVSGFLLKPANEADVRNVLENLRYPAEDVPAGVKVQCFGNFEVFVGGRPLSFKRSKSKELLAYLVDRNGATCTNGEMLAVLWEDIKSLLDTAEAEAEENTESSTSREEKMVLLLQLKQLSTIQTEQLTSL